MSDPFWKRTGFWTALTPSIVAGWEASGGRLTLALLLAAVGAWGTYFTAQKIRGPVGPVAPEDPPPNL